MTRDEIDAKLTQKVLQAALDASRHARGDGREGVSYPAMRAVLSSALQGEPERGKTCATCQWWTERDGLLPKRAVCGKFVCGPSYGYYITPDDFGCTLWQAQPDPPPPTTEGDRP